MDIASRRGFLRGLASLPLIGGSVTLIGQPTASAIPVTQTLLHDYKAWLRNEHWALCNELVDSNKQAAEWHRRSFYEGAGLDWHVNIAREAPSTRAAVILSAAGVLLPERADV